MSAQPINWSKVPHTELVSDSEDDAEVVEAKVGEKQQREEEAKVECRRQKEARKVEEAQRAEEARRVEEERRAEMVRQAEAARRREEAKRQKAINEARARMEREQQEEMQAWARAVMVTQGGETPGPSMAVAGPTPMACKRCTIHLQEPEGCVWDRGKWKASAEASEEEGGEDCDERITQRQGEAQEGTHNDNTEEVFGVPRVMAEEQRNALGMLTQALVQVVERMAAAEARDEERLALEQETVEIRRAHLAMARRAADCKEE
ncbi:hypothetical protein SCLCIDRAFT_19795 [Scleroderma citrinum Foug A]|uniref:Uncharacterized protein n=1 Tax=Scleroderma citrinum Foug A TaxID=1036808 RepID=A0A0C3EMW1_9AGAM|nr:hypothetical protein SCLCIDRAFT_19795 [Scleroderma citrinum Foug A]